MSLRLSVTVPQKVVDTIKRRSDPVKTGDAEAEIVEAIIESIQNHPTDDEADAGDDIDAESCLSICSDDDDTDPDAISGVFLGNEEHLWSSRDRYQIFVKNLTTSTITYGCLQARQCSN